MNSPWFFSWGLHEFGPFSDSEMKHFAVIGRLQPADPVWKVGMVSAHAVAASRVKNLFPASPLRTPSQTPLPTIMVDSQASAIADSLPTVRTPLVEPVPAMATASANPEAEDLAEIHSALAEEDLCPMESPLAESPPTPDATSVAVVETAPVKPIVKAPERVLKKTARAIRGAVIMSQDGIRVQYRKKCPICGHEDSSRQNIPIQAGMMRATFFCPTCKKPQNSELQGSVR